MAVVSLLMRFSKIAGSLVAAAGIALSLPAHAASSANADITAPLREAQATRSTAGDEEFHRLFASWRSLDGAGLPAATGTIAAAVPTIASPSKVSIPSLIPVEAVTTSGFGMRWHPVLGGRRAHKGIDLATHWGTPVHAPADGVVSHAEWFSSYGLYISLEHGGSIETRFGHLSRLNVAAGQLVHKGDVIGFVGSTGRSTGPHLHYEVRIDGVAVNPVPYLQQAYTSAPATPVASGAVADAHR